MRKISKLLLKVLLKIYIYNINNVYKIVNPYTNRKVSIFSKQGKIILTSYLDKQLSMKHGGKKALRGGYPLGPPRPGTPGGPNESELYTERRPEEQINQQFAAAGHPLVVPPSGHHLHNVLFLSADVLNRAREERLAHEVPFMDYLTQYMAVEGLAAIQRGGPITVAIREARRFLNLLSETGIRNLQQYKEWVNSPGPHNLARIGLLNPEIVEGMRRHIATYPQ